jgi:hypothetical protein
MGRKRSVYRVLEHRPEGKRRLEDPGADRSIILKKKEREAWKTQVQIGA